MKIEMSEKSLKMWGEYWVRGFDRFLCQTHVTTWFTLQTSILRVDHQTQVEVWVWEPLKFEYWEFSQCITITETSVLSNFVLICCENMVSNSPQHFWFLTCCRVVLCCILQSLVSEPWNGFFFTPSFYLCLYWFRISHFHI